MTDIDRLIELCVEFKHNECGDLTYCDIDLLVDRLIANGVIVPPCKVGDMVYETQLIRKRVQEYEVTTIKYNGHYWWFTWILKDRKGIYGNVDGFSSHQIGKTVFLTKEEAERALAEAPKGEVE